MSGALKHFFDGIYYPCLEATQRRPYGLYVHGGMDTTGAVRAVQAIATGLRWRTVRPPVCVTGAPAKQDLLACWELGELSRPRSPGDRHLLSTVAGAPAEGCARISVEATASLEECDTGKRGQPVHQPVLESQVTGL